MKYLFIMRHALFTRNFDSVIRKLADDGHHIHFGFTTKRKHISNELPEALAKEYPNISYDYTPKLKHPWGKHIDLIRDLRNYIRYFDSCFKNCESLKARARKKIPEKWVKRFNRLSPELAEKLHKPLDRFLSFLEESAPRLPEAVDYIKSFSPDILLISPLYELGIKSVDFAKAARQLSIPTCVCVASWDNLTNKGIIQGKPDFVTLWNDIQKNEAVKLHNMNSDQVFTTGAQIFDEWFGKKPSVSRDDFCQKMKLSSERKIITWLCSSVFISQNEVDFVLNWAKEIRASDNPELKDINILVRPHPTSGQEFWKETDPRFHEIENLTVWPEGGELPGDQFSKDSYFNTLHWSDFVVGVNTSAFIEAGITKTPCFTIEDKTYTGTQDGTVHFHYLTDGGLVRSAESMKAHIEQLKESLANPEPHLKSIEKFTESFVRPHGIEISATDTFVEVLTKEIPARYAELNPSGRKQQKVSHEIAAYILPALLSMDSKQGSSAKK